MPDAKKAKPGVGGILDIPEGLYNFDEVASFAQDAIMQRIQQVTQGLTDVAPGPQEIKAVPPTPPRLTFPQTPSEYLESVGAHLQGLVESKAITKEKAEDYASRVYDQIKSEGITEKTLFYNEIVGEPKKTYEAEYRTFQTARKPWDKYIEELREYQEKRNQATRDAHTEEQRLKAEAEYNKKVEQANFEFVEKQTSTKEYATARQELDKLWDETLKSDMTQGQKQGILLNAINKVGTKYNFDPLAMENLQRRAVNEVFETLPQREKDLQRLRAQYPWQESRYAQRIPSEEMPEYERIFEEQRVQTPGTANFLQIFEREYPNLVRKYQATLPEERQTTAKVEEGWAGYLRNYVSQLKESEARKSPWERGERPSFFAPPIKKVGF